MGNRTIAQINCYTCGMVQRDCICHLKQEINLQTRVSVIIPVSEWHKSSNTGRLVKLALSNSEIFIKGKKQAPLNFRDTLCQGYENVILCPNGRILNQNFLDSLSQPLNLIVPDGTYYNARKIIRRNCEFHSLPKLSLPYLCESQYHLRKGMKASYLSTLEAIARAMSIIEGEHIQNILEVIFQEKVNRLLKQKGAHHRFECSVQSQLKS